MYRPFLLGKIRSLAFENWERRRHSFRDRVSSDDNGTSLRHYAVSTWIEAGLAPKTIQTFAGHSSLQVTMDRYGHLFPSDDHKAAMDAIAGELMG